MAFSASEAGGYAVTDILTPEEFSLRLLVAHEPDSMKLLNAHDRVLRAERDRYRDALERIVRGEEEAPVGMSNPGRTARAALAGPDVGTESYHEFEPFRAHRRDVCRTCGLPDVNPVHPGPDTGEGS